MTRTGPVLIGPCVSVQQVNFEEFKDGFVDVLSHSLDISTSEEDSSYLEPGEAPQGPLRFWFCLAWFLLFYVLQRSPRRCSLSWSKEPNATAGAPAQNPGPVLVSPPTPGSPLHPEATPQTLLHPPSAEPSSGGPLLWRAWR